MSPALATATPYVLKCTTDKGEAAADLTVDLDGQVMLWGGTRYKITSETDRYVTGMADSENASPPYRWGGLGAGSCFRAI